LNYARANSKGNQIYEKRFAEEVIAKL